MAIWLNKVWRSALVLQLIPWTVSGQQFDMYRIPYETMNLSQDCLGVLNTNVSCDYGLAISTKL